MDETDQWAVLDDQLPRPVRTYLEERFWRPIEAQASLEVLCDDPAFLADPGTHPAMFADHGVVHVRDVAIGLVRLLDTIDGVLIPGRPAADAGGFLESLGVAAAYLHDIGMVDMTPLGRRIHPLFAAHAAFGPDVDPLVDHLLAPGPVRTRLDDVAARAPFGLPLEIVVREMLSMSLTHSKSAVPAARPRRPGGAPPAACSGSSSPSLDEHRASRRLPSADDTSPIGCDANTGAYDDPSQSYAWLSASERAAGRARRRRAGRDAGAAGRGRAATARDRPAHIRRFRALHGRRDRASRVHDAVRGRRCRVRDRLRR